MSREDYDKVPAELQRICFECRGYGEVATSHRYTCHRCDGRGWVPAPGVEELLRRVRQG